MSIRNHFVSTAVSLIGKSVQVSNVQKLSPNIVQIRLEGPNLQKIQLNAGDKIKLHIGQGWMRSYTPSRFDLQQGWMEIVIHVHGNGAASDWAAALQGGEETAFLGPASSMKHFAEPVQRYLFWGDETTLGLAQALYESLPEGTDFTAYIELKEEDCVALETFDYPYVAVYEKQRHGLALLHQLEELNLAPETSLGIWLSGEAGTVLELRKRMLSQGIQREQLRIKPYWSVKGKAHRKQLEKNDLLQ